jgi:hypothetical protein
MSALLRLARRSLLVGGGVLALGGCAGVGMADVLSAGGAGDRNVSGELRGVDERSRTIQVSSWYGSSHVRYDGRTQVINNGRSMSIRNLERGDRVSIQVQRNNRGDLYARRIHVERGGWNDRRADDRRNARMLNVEGRVHRIEHRAGWMEVRPDRGSSVRVSLPDRASGQQVSEFRRIRRGDYVRVQGRQIGNNRVELVRIR